MYNTITVYFDLLQQKLSSNEMTNQNDDDNGIWDSMAAMATEEWNDEETVAVNDLIPNG